MKPCLIHSLFAFSGHGNHFQQSYTHAYGVIMEPIFARLGVYATSRNFAFGGLGTIQTGVAASALMGPDVDLLMWDSGMTEKGDSIAVLGIQAILGGDRIPMFLVDKFGKGYVDKLYQECGLDGGVIGTGLGLTPKVNTPEELEALPWAAKCLNFGGDLRAICKGNSYRGNCWFDRSNFTWGGMNMSFTPAYAAMIDLVPKQRTSWHPGDRHHQLKGRVLAGLVLHGMRDALLLWKNSEQMVLKDEDWHGKRYITTFCCSVW